jgi:hypothetical protein
MDVIEHTKKMLTPVDVLCYGMWVSLHKLVTTPTRIFSFLVMWDVRELST